MKPSSSTPKGKRQKAACYREAARKIAQGHAAYIATGSHGGSLPSDAEVNELFDLAGELVWFDDDGLTPTQRTRHERVMFLCFAADITERP